MPIKIDLPHRKSSLDFKFITHIAANQHIQIVTNEWKKTKTVYFSLRSITSHEIMFAFYCFESQTSTEN